MLTTWSKTFEATPPFETSEIIPAIVAFLTAGVLFYFLPDVTARPLLLLNERFRARAVRGNLSQMAVSTVLELNESGTLAAK
jgi:hypothetical protein